MEGLSQEAKTLIALGELEEYVPSGIQGARGWGVGVVKVEDFHVITSAYWCRTDKFMRWVSLGDRPHFSEVDAINYIAARWMAGEQP